MEVSGPEPQPYPKMAASSGSGDPLKLPDDAELLKRTGRGDEGAFRLLVDRHGRYLHGIAYSLSGNVADAEDLVQETFVGALTSQFRGEAAVRTWLVQILVRRAAMLRRSRKRRILPWTAAGDADLDAPAVPEPMSPAKTGGADARLDLARMLEALSPEHRQVIVLRELHGLSYEEIAEALDVPRGTVESRLHRARGAMREKFKDYLT